MGNERINVNASALDSEIATHRSRNERLTSIRYRANKGSLRLRSATELTDCLNELDGAMADFNALVGKDIAYLEAIRNEFIRTDAQEAARIGMLMCHGSGGNSTPDGFVQSRGSSNAGGGW